MHPPLNSRWFRARWLILAFAVIASPRAATAADPVVELAQVLLKEINADNPAEVRKEVERQKELLEKSAAAVTRLADMRSALLLPGWKRVGGGQQPDEDDPLEKIHRAVWDHLAGRLAKALRSRLGAEDDPYRRLAAATFLAEMASAENKAEQEGIPTPGTPSGMRGGWPVFYFTPLLAGDLRKRLAKDKDADVCATAARAVAEIAPFETATLEALKPLLEPGRKVVERRAAAEGLAHMFRALTDPQQGESRGPGNWRQHYSQRIDRIGPRLVSAAGTGLNDKDAAIRRLGLETIRQAARHIQDGQEVARTLAGAVNEQTAAAAGLLADGDLAVRLSAHQVLEDVAGARRHLRGSGRPIPKKPAEDQALLDGVLKALPALKTSLADDEVRVRLAALYVLETLDDAATPAVEEIVKALKDKNGFVRWGAARVLNNMAPRASDKAVPALAEALSDANKTVRLTAVAALRRYGPKAAAAVQPLAKAIGDAEPRMRIGVLNALASIGAKARPAAGMLVQTLRKDKTPEARAAAAQALGQLGRLDAEAVKALRNALSDSAAAVRQAASDALLDDGP